MSSDPDQSSSRAVTARPANRSSEFVGDLARMSFGGIGSQIVAVLVTPVLSRLFTPEAFGAAATFFAFALALGSIACLRYDVALMLPKKLRHAANLLALSIAMAVTLAITLFFLLWAARSRWTAPFDGILPLWWLVPIATFLTGFQSSLSYWNTRQKEFKRQSVAQLVNSGITNLSRLLCGWHGMTSSVTLVWTQLTGQLAAIASQGYSTIRTLPHRFVRLVSLREMLSVARLYRRFPLMDIWSTLSNNMSVYLPVFILSAFFPASVVGYYAVANRILNLPMSVIGRSLSQVFFQRAAVAKQDGTLGNLVGIVVRAIVSVTAFPFMLLALISPELFSMFLGPQWYQAGVFAQLLAPWLFFVFLGSPISTLVHVLDRQGVLLSFNLFLLAVRSASLIAGGLYGSADLAVGLFSFSGFVLWAGFSLYLIKLAGVKTLDMLRILTRPLLQPLGFVAIVGLWKFSAPTNYSWTVCIAAIVGFAYSLLAWKNEPVYRNLFNWLIQSLAKTKAKNVGGDRN